MVAEVNIEVAGEDRTTKTAIEKTVTNESENGALPKQRTTSGAMIGVNLRNIVTATMVCTICFWKIILLIQLV